MKPEIPAGKFVILNRINKQGETTINLRFHMDGYVKRSTGIAIPPAAWDEKKCCVKASYPQAARINADLAAFKQDIDRKLLEYDGKITKNVLNFILNGILGFAIPISASITECRIWLCIDTFCSFRAIDIIYNISRCLLSIIYESPAF